jgi:hypothetical protein
MSKMVGWGRVANLAGVLLVIAGTAVAQEAAAPILSHTFEENDGGWQGLGTTATVSLTHDANFVKGGKGALQFAYGVKKGELNMLLLPTPDKVLSTARSIRFWVKTDHASPLAVVLQEKDGARYNTMFSVRKGAWQQVELSIADFVVDSGKDAPKDANGKLDLDDVGNVGIIDIAQLFVQGDEALAKAFGIETGTRNLYLDDFSVSPTALAASATLKNGEGSLDTFARPQVGWMAMGGVELSRVTGKPLEGAGMQAKYHQAPAAIAGFAKYVPTAGLLGATKLALSVASEKPAKLIVQVEERGGGKYNTTIELPGNSGRADLSLNFADFKAAMDSHDDNNRLDLDQVTQIILFDGTGLLDGADTDNTLWINNIKAVK